MSASVERIGPVDQTGVEPIIAMLHEAISDLREGNRTACKAVVLFLNDEDDDYTIGFANSGMSSSEIIALIEVNKLQLYQTMFGDED